MKKIANLFLLAVFLLLSVLAFGQDAVVNYKPLESQGPMPADFAKITTSDKDLADYNVMLKRLVMEGDIFYGSKLNDYVNTIADNLLKDDPVLRSKIHLYIIKSTEVNAFATANGLLFVNMGLLAQVSNESELAFVLGHEIAHYAEKHIESFNTYQDSLKDKDPINYYLKYHNRSRTHEMEADRISLERYMKQSQYSYTVLDGIFDVLQYSDLPFDEVPFNKSLVETSFYHFPDNYFLTNITPISSRADMVDTLFTHPNIERRRTAARSIVAGMSETGRSVFVQPESLFNEVRELARFECVRILLSRHSYDHAFYNTYVLQRAHPNNVYLEEAMVSALYGLSKHKNYGQVSATIESYKDVEGELQQTSHFFAKIGKQEASLLALRAAWKARQNHPDNIYYKEVIDDLMKDIFVKNKMKYTDFSDYPMGTDPATIQTEDNTPQDSTINKYERIRQQGKPTKVLPTPKFKTMNYMLVDIHQEPAFYDLMSNTLHQAEDEEVLKVVDRNKPATVKSVILADPQYVLSTNGSKKVAQKEANKRAERLLKTLRTSLKKLKLDPVTYSVKDVKGLSTEDYNKYAKLQQWLNEYFQSDGIAMVSPLTKDMNDVYELTGTSTVCVAAVRRGNAGFAGYNKIQNILLGVLCPYYFVPAAIEFGFPRYDTDMYLMLLDLEKGKTLLAGHDSQISAMSDAYVNAFMYDKLYEFVKGKKK